MARRLSKPQKFLQLCVVLLFISSGIARAQGNAEVLANVQLNFSTPGARSLGLGGAFLGLADDATAAFTNPAGLTILSKPEVSAEGRKWSYSQNFTDRGHGFGDPKMAGGEASADRVAGLVTGSSKNDVTGLSFLSFVYPGKRWAVAVYRHELANFETSFRTHGPFFDSTDSKTLFRVRPIDARLDLSIVNLGVSGAFRVHDNFSIGLGLSSYNFTLNSVLNRYNFNRSPDIPPDTSLGGFYGEPNYDPTNVVNFQTLHGDDNNLALNGGLHWKVSSAWSIGAVYRQGPKFTMKTTSTRGPASGDNGHVIATNPATFHVPDVYGVGLAFHPSDSLTITADYDRVRYSNLSEKTVDIFDPTGTQDPNSTQTLAAKHLKAEDANELHLGLEYVFPLKHPIALRIGSWLDPDHTTHFTGSAVTDDDRSAAVRFRKGKEEVHYSAGLGVVFSDKFQIDAAFDTSSLVKTASFSGVFRF